MRKLFKSILSFSTERDRSAIADMGEFIRNNESISPADKREMASLAASVRDRMEDRYKNPAGGVIKNGLKVLGGVAAIAVFPPSSVVVLPAAAILAANGLKNMLPGNAQKNSSKAIENQKQMAAEAERFSAMVMGALKNSPDTPEANRIKEAVKNNARDASFSLPALV